MRDGQDSGCFPLPVLRLTQDKGRMDMKKKKKLLKQIQYEIFFFAGTDCLYNVYSYTTDKNDYV